MVRKYGDNCVCLPPHFFTFCLKKIESKRRERKRFSGASSTSVLAAICLGWIFFFKFILLMESRLLCDLSFRGSGGSNEFFRLLNGLTLEIFAA